MEVVVAAAAYRLQQDHRSDLGEAQVVRVECAHGDLVVVVVVYGGAFHDHASHRSSYRTHEELVHDREDACAYGERSSAL